MSFMLDYIKETKEFTYELVYDKDNNATHIYLKNLNGKYYMVIISPHEGNNHKYIIRANMAETFDKWSNCEYEESYSTTLKCFLGFEKLRSTMDRKVKENANKD